MSSSRISGISVASWAILTRVSAIASRSAAGQSRKPLQQAVDPRPRHQAPGEDHVQRRQRQRLVVHHLDRGAAGTEQHDRPEGRIVGEADDQFPRPGPEDHRLNHETLDAGVGQGRRHPLRHCRSGRGRLLPAQHIESDPAHVGLVRDVVRHDLDRAAAARPGCLQEPLGSPADLVRVGSEQRFRNRNLIGREHPLGLRLGQERATGADRTGDDRACGSDVRREFARYIRRRPHQFLLGPGMTDHMAETAHRPAGCRECRNAGLLEPPSRQPDGILPEPARQHRLGRLVGLHGFDHRLGDRVGRLQSGRAVHHQDRVVAGVIEHDVQRRPVAGLSGIADDVDRIVSRPCRRQGGVEPRHGLRRQPRDRSAEVRQPFDREDAGAAAIGHDRQPVAAEGFETAERFRRVEQFVEIVHSQQAGAGEGCVVNRVRSGQRTRV